MLKQEKSKEIKRLRFLEIEIDQSSGTVWRAGEVVDLPDLSYRLLDTLARHAPEMVSKDALIAEVWAGVVVSDETLMQRIRLLRQALGDDGQNPRIIGAVRGRGYRMLPVVESVTQADRSAPEPSQWKLRRTLTAVAAGLVLLGLLIFGLQSGMRDASPRVAIETLAVLPFDDLSDGGGYGFFADGMQEELLSRLSQLPEISVLSRTSTEQFRDSAQGIPAIARILKAGALIEGSVRVHDERVRITVQLIEGASDQHLWAESYEEALTVENLFSIQNTVADRIANALQIEYRRQRSDALGLPTASIEAYQRYLLGRFHTFRQTPDDLERAVRYLQEAVAIDSSFAEAHASLGWAYSFQGSEYGRSTPAASFPRAREAALRALALDDRLADAHSLYGDILTWYDWDFALAESEYRRAMQLDPLNVLGYALLLSTQGRHAEAVELVEQRTRATPTDEYAQLNAGWRYLHAGRLDEALSAVARAGDHPDAPTLAGFARLLKGEDSVAIDIFEEDLRKQGRSLRRLENLAYVYLKAGAAERAAPILDELENSEASPPSLPLAAAYLAAGDEARGFELLRAAIDARARGVIFLMISPLFVDRRDDPRLQALAREVGLPLP